MTPAESDAIDAVLIARGYRIIGNVSPDVNGATDEEVAMLFVGDVKGAIRDLIRASLAREVERKPPRFTEHHRD